ncbi:hypothetical protein FQZ97_1197210 [compost metagenome]
MVNTLICFSKRSITCCCMASSLAWSTAPLRAMPASITMAMVLAACSPPMTAVRAFGQDSAKRGAKPRPHMP